MESTSKPDLSFGIEKILGISAPLDCSLKRKETKEDLLLDKISCGRGEGGHAEKTGMCTAMAANFTQ